MTDEDNDAFDAVVWRNQGNEIFAKEALEAQDGKEVPLTDKPGGEVIGTAKLYYVEGENVLRAHFHVDDPEWAELLKREPPNIFGM